VIVATSGSTGIPKCAVLPIPSLLANAAGVNELLSLRSDDCWQLSLPLFHVGGLGILFRTLLAGSSLAVSTNGDVRSSEIAVPVSFLSLVPTQLYRFLREQHSREYLKQQRCILLGGAPIGADLCRRAQEYGLPVVPSYGLTEMGSLVTADVRISIADDKAISMGETAGGREISVAPSGEILVRGECLFAGYLTEEGVVRELTSDGWFCTGDIGSCDANGSLFVIGRVDAQFISGGENIHPEMIEQALTAIAPIIAACVVPVDDPEFGQRPFAFVVTDGVSFNVAAIRSELRNRIPRFAIPTDIIAAPPEFVTGSGKIARARALQYAREYSAARSRE
jgi:O-succinylbenzoic acid--CoA ligase